MLNYLVDVCFFGYSAATFVISCRRERNISKKLVRIAKYIFQEASQTKKQVFLLKTRNEVSFLQPAKY